MVSVKLQAWEQTTQGLLFHTFFQKRIQTVDKGLPPLGKCRPDHLKKEVRVLHHRRGLFPDCHTDHRGGHLGSGKKAGGRHIIQQRAVGVILAEKGEGPVFRRSRLGTDPLCHSRWIITVTA